MENKERVRNTKFHWIQCGVLTTFGVLGSFLLPHLLDKFMLILLLTFFGISMMPSPFGFSADGRRVLRFIGFLSFALCFGIMYGMTKESTEAGKYLLGMLITILFSLADTRDKLASKVKIDHGEQE